MLLRYLAQPASMGEMAQALACDPSNVTGLVDRMAARGLVCRVTDAKDQRVKHVVLTDQGRAQRAALQARLFARSPAIDTLAPHERRQLLLLLRKLTPGIGETGAV
jgi:DNA-binding MarR family transcriptional regulator